MPQYITDLQVSLNENDEKQLSAQGFSKSDVNLNKVAGGKNIHLWYKRGDSGAITRIHFSFNDAMSEGLTKAGYQKINKNLNAGAGGNCIYLWFFKGSSEHHVPIVHLDVSTTDEAQKFKSYCETLSCDLNQDAGRHQIFLSVKRENPTYICDIAAIVNFQGVEDYLDKGYNLAWLDTNTGAGGDNISLWFRQTTKPEEAIKDLQVSTSGEDYPGYVRLNVDLNQGTGGNPVFLWYKKDGSSDPIKDVFVKVIAVANQFKNEGWIYIYKNLNEGVKDAPVLYLRYRR